MDLILAAGAQTRWTHNKVPGLPLIKQLVEVDGKILIEKIQEQFEDSIVITHDKEISKHSRMVFKPASHEVTIATLFSTHELWKEWTTILLGDVRYGRETVKLIKRQEQQLMFYGDKGEIYAFKFHKDVIPLIHFAINTLINHKDWTPRFGKIWNLYRVICGDNYRLDNKKEKYFTFVKDCKDFDTQQEYQKYVKSQRVRK